ncbi:hypothetical protein BGZ76_002222 [Entomortierella beljakovae]|nr:hypothetical protein BGZ76_002222 [Entomortierella beljakovae]
MDSSEEPIHVIIRLPYARPEGYVNTQPVQWTEAMEKTLWNIIGQTKPSLIDWNAISRQLGNIPVPFLIKHATSLFENQLQDLHRIGEQQDQSIQGTGRGTIGPGTANTSFEDSPSSLQPSPLSQGVFTTRDSSPLNSPKIGHRQYGDKDLRKSTKKEPSQIQGLSTNNSNPNITQSLEASAKAQASPSLSGSISTFPSHARPASMSSSASTIRPVQPSSPSPSLRSTSTTADTNFYGSGILSNRGPPQPRSTRGSQLISVAPSSDRRISNLLSTLPTSPREDSSYIDNGKRVMEPSNPFQHATISASARLGSSASGGRGTRNSPGRINDNGQGGTPGFNDSERSSTVSSASTPYSQSNSTSQIFEETSFFNQLSSNDSLTRGQLRNENFEGISSRGAFQQQSYSQNQGVYGLGFMDPAPYYQQDHRGMDGEDDDDDDDGGSSGRDGDSVNQDDSGPLSEQIKQLHLEDVLAFLPRGGPSASGILSRLPDETGYQRRTTSGEKMPFQLDDELASLGPRTLGEILDHDGGDDEDDHRVQAIRFKDSMRPIRSREGDPSKIRSSPERSNSTSRKSSAQNSVGSSFSDLSDSSVTQSAMEDAYLSGYNNNSRM